MRRLNHTILAALIVLLLISAATAGCSGNTAQAGHSYSRFGSPTPLEK